MPINQTANLLAYYNQNTPNSSQITPVQNLTYPAIPGTVTTMPITSVADMSINDILSPFSTLPISGLVTTIAPATIGAFSSPQLSGLITPSAPATIGAFTPQQFATGVPGTMAYNDAYTNPNLPNSPTSPASTPTGYYTPNGSLLNLGGGIESPPNNMSPISALPAGTTEIYKEVVGVTPWRQSDVLSLIGDNKTLGAVNYFDVTSTKNSGFTLGFTPGTQTKYTGVTGDPGSLQYTKPVGIYVPTDNKFNSVSKYRADINTKTLFDGIVDGNTKIDIPNQDTPLSLYDRYIANNFDSMKLKYESLKVPYITRGIQKATPDLATYEDLPSWADEHKKRLELAIEDSTFSSRRKKMQIYQYQSRFQLSLGVLPHMLLSGGAYNLKQDLKIKQTDPLSMAASAAWIVGGTIARVPYGLIDYAVPHSHLFAYGLGSGQDQKIYDLLRELNSKVLDQASPDLIPFYFDLLHTGKGKTTPTLFEDTILQFRGTLKTVSTSVTPQWSSKKYFGRPDSVHTYNGYDQNLSFSFQLYAASRTDMKNMYKGLNKLKGLCKPGWDATKSFMIGPVTQLSIGDYIQKQPGFIKSLSISPDEQIYWDLGKDPIRGFPQIIQAVPAGLTDKLSSFNLLKPLKGLPNAIQKPKVPRAFNISINYQFIEKEMPDADGTAEWGMDILDKPKGAKAWLL